MKVSLRKKIVLLLIFVVAAGVGAAKAVGDYYFKLHLNQHLTNLQPLVSVSYQAAFLNYALQGEVQHVLLQTPDGQTVTAQQILLKDLYTLPEQMKVTVEQIRYEFNRAFLLKGNLLVTLQNKNEERYLNAHFLSEEWGELKLQTTLKTTGQLILLEADYKVGKSWQQLMPHLSSWFVQVESLPIPTLLKDPILAFLKQPKNFKLTCRPTVPMLPINLISTPPEQWGLSVLFN